MGHPVEHAHSSARRFGGLYTDYLPIHDFFDSSKESFPDNRHRALLHTTFGIFLAEKVFGHEIPLTCQKCEGTGNDPDNLAIKCPKCGGATQCGTAKVRYIGEQHILEDYAGKFIPTVSDFFSGMEYKEWMNNGKGEPPESHRMLARKDKKTIRRSVSLD